MKRLTKGEKNRLVDALLHPLAKGNAKIPVILFDSIVHGFIERNPKVSMRKFVRYSLPKILEKARR